MDELHDQDGDDLDRLLSPSATVGDRALRLTLLHRTLRHVGRRRRLRRLGLVSTLAACFLAGMVTMHWTYPASVPQIVVVAPKPDAQNTAPTATSKPSKIQDASRTAIAMEYRALDSTRDRAELYRQAGDRYLDESDDVSSALRCYRQVVDESKPKDLTISANDNWLLMALKEAKRKESAHEGKDS